MLRPALVALCAATIATGVVAQSTGVAVCDDFLKKYEICINTKYSADTRKIAKESLDDLRKMFEVLASVEGPSAAEKNCKERMDGVKALLQPIGCTF